MTRYLLTIASLLVAPFSAAAQQGYGAGYGGAYGGGSYGDWSGPYVSGTLAFGNTSTSSDASGPTVSISDVSAAYALAIGRQWQSGALVYGGEVALFDVTGDLDGIGRNFEVDRGLRMTGRLGYGMGQSMAYATLGIARADFGGAGIYTDSTALVVGAGIDLHATDRVTLGAEYVRHFFGNVTDAGGPGRDADVAVGTLGLKLSFGF